MQLEKTEKAENKSDSDSEIASVSTFDDNDAESIYSLEFNYNSNSIKELLEYILSLVGEKSNIILNYCIIIYYFEIIFFIIKNNNINDYDSLVGGSSGSRPIKKIDLPALIRYNSKLIKPLRLYKIFYKSGLHGKLNEKGEFIDEELDKKIEADFLTIRTKIFSKEHILLIIEACQIYNEKTLDSKLSVKETFRRNEITDFNYLLQKCVENLDLAEQELIKEICEGSANTEEPVNDDEAVTSYILNTFNNLYTDLIDILNTDLYYKLLCIFKYDPCNFITLILNIWKRLGLSDGAITSCEQAIYDFFLIILNKTATKNLIDELKTMGIHYKSECDKSTLLKKTLIDIINELPGVSKNEKLPDKCLFIITLLDILFKYINNVKITSLNIIDIFSYWVILNIKTLQYYSLYKLKDGIEGIVTETYEEIMTEKQQLFFYLKVRSDSTAYNPRYDCRVDNSNFLLRYYDYPYPALPYKVDSLQSMKIEELTDAVQITEFKKKLPSDTQSKYVHFLNTTDCALMYVSGSDTFIKYSYIDKGNYSPYRKWDETSFINLTHEFRKNQIKKKKEYKYIFSSYDDIVCDIGSTDKKTNEDAYNKYKPKIIKNFMDKKHICVLANGLTGSGKTSLLFKRESSVSSVPDEDGIIKLLLTELTSSSYGFKIKQISYKELYCHDSQPVDETIADTESVDTILTKITTIFKQRKTGLTIHNETSSRSHLLICINFKNQESLEGYSITIVDLAGYENEFSCKDHNYIFTMQQKMKQDSELSKKFTSQVKTLTSDKNFKEIFDINTKSLIVQLIGEKKKFDIKKIEDLDKLLREYNDLRHKAENSQTYQTHIKHGASEKDKISYAEGTVYVKIPGRKKKMSLHTFIHKCIRGLENRLNIAKAEHDNLSSQDTKTYNELVIELTNIYLLCEIRNKEGNAIRKSLIDFKQKLKKKFGINSIKRNLNSCNDVHNEVDRLLDIIYNDHDTKSEVDEEKKGIMYYINTLGKGKGKEQEKEKEQELDNIPIFIINIVDLTDSIENNNPTFIPFIDLNEIYNLMFELKKDHNVDTIIEKKNKIIDLIKLLIYNLKKYKYYYNYGFTFLKDIIDALPITFGQRDINSFISGINDFLQIINDNNNLTLIGTLNYSEFLLYTEYNKMCSYNEITTNIRSIKNFFVDTQETTHGAAAATSKSLDDDSADDDDKKEFYDVEDDIQDIKFLSVYSKELLDETPEEKEKYKKFLRWNAAHTQPAVSSTQASPSRLVKLEAPRPEASGYPRSELLRQQSVTRPEAPRSEASGYPKQVLPRQQSVTRPEAPRLEASTKIRRPSTTRPDALNRPQSETRTASRPDALNRPQSETRTASRPDATGLMRQSYKNRPERPIPDNSIATYTYHNLTGNFQGVRDRDDKFCLKNMDTGNLVRHPNFGLVILNGKLIGANDERENFYEYYEDENEFLYKSKKYGILEYYPYNRPKYDHYDYGQDKVYNLTFDENTNKYIRDDTPKTYPSRPSSMARSSSRVNPSSRAGPSSRNKYLKYKQKYINLKKKLITFI